MPASPARLLPWVCYRCVCAAFLVRSLSSFRHPRRVVLWCSGRPLRVLVSLSASLRVAAAAFAPLPPYVAASSASFCLYAVRRLCCVLLARWLPVLGPLSCAFLSFLFFFCPLTLCPWAPPWVVTLSFSFAPFLLLLVSPILLAAGSGGLSYLFSFALFYLCHSSFSVLFHLTIFALVGSCVFRFPPSVLLASFILLVASRLRLLSPSASCLFLFVTSPSSGISLALLPCPLTVSRPPPHLPPSPSH